MIVSYWWLRTAIQITDVNLFVIYRCFFSSSVFICKHPFPNTQCLCFMICTAVKYVSLICSISW